MGLNHRFEETNQTVSTRLSEQSLEITNQKLEIRRVLQKLDEQAESIMRYLTSEKNFAEEVKTNQNTKNRVTEKPDQKDTYSEIDYFNFENHFRGTREDVKDSQKWYLPYFEGKSDILDIGCGRGEFLELLKEHGTTAKGIDIYPEYVRFCRLKGLDVSEGDAIEYIGNLPDHSLGGLFAAQFIEHIGTEQLLYLCSQAYRTLQKGACVVLETPNPTSLAIYMNAFYMDPSHNKPVHPKTLEYFLQQAGFRDIEIVFTEHSIARKLPKLNAASDVENLEEFNEGVEAVAKALFGSQDYAIIAKK